MMTLTELQAIEILDKVRLEYKGTPQDHVVIAQAIEKVKELVEKLTQLEAELKSQSRSVTAEVV